MIDPMKRELVERAMRGDHDAFTALVSASTDRLFAAATLILRDRSTAEDAVQEALTRAWRDLPRLRNADRFDLWLHRILTRACYDQARARRRRRAEISLIPAHEPAVHDESVGIADRDALSRGFRRLSVEHRAALVLRHYSGLSVPDVATALSVPLGTAKSRLHHAERALRAALEADARFADDVRGTSA
jgi:RNA polymerase sigma-70 factor, ECF subfamily